ncbi:UNVERIFIED_CONTAM: hypothetical protein Sindi_2502000 [Sesamum indicum]
MSWILNSLSKDIVESFLYAASARDLWLELESRFGENSGPLLYQIQREIASISQENMSVAVYFTKLKRLWDELTSFNPLPSCNCGASKMSERIASNELMQFMMGLSDIYDHVRNQVLLMDPLPTVGKAYSMVQRVEKQREIHSGVTVIDKEGVMTVQTGEAREGSLTDDPPRKETLWIKECCIVSIARKLDTQRTHALKLMGPQNGISFL